MSIPKKVHEDKKHFTKQEPPQSPKSQPEMKQTKWKVNFKALNQRFLDSQTLTVNQITSWKDNKRIFSSTASTETTASPAGQEGQEEPVLRDE